MEKIYFLHTNDLHSHLENWPSIRRFLNERKSQLKKSGASVITVDLGDFVDRVHPLTEASDGQANIQLMNQVAYDAATIGNNEGVGNSKSQLNNLYTKAKFPIVLANLLDKETKAPPFWAEPYHIVTTKEGTRIALIGLTAPFSLTYQPNGWEPLATDEVLPQILAEVEGKSDGIVLLSHLGLPEDKRIAEKYPEIQLILGSHTHHLLPNGLKVKQTLIAAAGKFGRYIGEVNLTMKQHRLVASTAKVYEVANFPVTESDQTESKSYQEAGQAELAARIIADTPIPFLRDGHGKTASLAELALESFSERTNDSLVAINNGLFMADLPKGLVNQAQLHRLLPHPMHLIRVTLLGTDFTRFLQEVDKNKQYLRHFPITGMGFRGKEFGDIFFKGIMKQNGNYLINNQPINPQMKYTLTTVDHWLFIPFFPSLEIAGQIEFVYPEFIRTIVANYLETHYPYTEKKGILGNKSKD